MSLIGTIASNPDYATAGVAIAGYLGRLLWKRAKALTESELWDTMLKVAHQAFPRLLNDSRLYDDAYVREVITKTIWAGLTRLSVPKNQAAMDLVADVVEHAVGELAMMVTQYHFGKLTAALGATAAEFKKLPEDKAITPPPDDEPVVIGFPEPKNNPVPLP